MAYKMRYKVIVKLITPQGEEEDAGADDVNIVEVGDVTTLFNEDGSFATTPTGPIIGSLPAATSAVMKVVNALQRGLKTNVRFEVYGKPVGTPEEGAEDIPDQYKNLLLYIAGDTPNAGLLYYIARANRKPRTDVTQAVYLPPDVLPEPYVGNLQGQGPLAPGGGGGG